MAPVQKQTDTTHAGLNEQQVTADDRL